MSAGPAIDPKRVVIAGGGIAAVEALMGLADRGERQLQITLLSSRDRFMLRPQLIGEPWGGEALSVDLRRLTDDFDATLQLETVVGVEPGIAVTAAGARVAFDELIVAVGAWPSLPYAGAQTIGFGSLPGALVAGAAGSVAIVVPPGVGWTLPAYQLALQVAGAAPGRVTVVTPERVSLEQFGMAAHDADQLLQTHGVKVATQTNVPIGMNAAELADTVLALPLLHGPSLAGLPTNAAGFHPVDELMRVVGVPNVHVVGDATHGHIKQGGLAGQQADVAVADIAHGAGNPLAPGPYEPVLRGKLVAPDGTSLYLRRALDGDDAGKASPRPLWEPAGILCAWRLVRWLNVHRDELGADPLEPLARPWPTQRSPSGSSTQ